MPRDALYFCAGDQRGGSLTVLALTAGLSASRKAIRGWLDELLDRLLTIDVDGEDVLVSADDVADLTSTTVAPTGHTPAPGRRSMGDGMGHRGSPRGTSFPSAAGGPAARQPGVTGGGVAGTWTRKVGTLTVVWFGEAEPPDQALLREEAAHLAAILKRGDSP